MLTLVDLGRGDHIVRLLDLVLVVNLEQILLKSVLVRRVLLELLLVPVVLAILYHQAYLRYGLLRILGRLDVYLGESLLWKLEWRIGKRLGALLLPLIQMAFNLLLLGRVLSVFEGRLRILASNEG